MVGHLPSFLLSILPFPTPIPPPFPNNVHNTLCCLVRLSMCCWSGAPKEATRVTFPALTSFSRSSIARFTIWTPLLCLWPWVTALLFTTELSMRNASCCHLPNRWGDMRKRVAQRHAFFLPLISLLSLFSLFSPRLFMLFVSDRQQRMISSVLPLNPSQQFNPWPLHWTFDGKPFLSI